MGDRDNKQPADLPPESAVVPIGADAEPLEQGPLIEPVPARPSRPVGLTPDGRLTGGKLAGLTLSAAIFTLSWPILADSLLNALVGLTDTVLSAAMDDGGKSTDAVGGAVTILWFVQLVVQAVGVGATALISRAIGARKVGVANAGLAQTLILAAVCGVGVALGIAAVAPAAATAMSLGEGVRQPFIDFIRLNALGVVFGSILFAGIACARAAGDSFRPLIVMIFVNLVNCSVSWLLSGVDLKSASVVDGQPVTRWILHNPSGLDWGVRGIAIGTSVSYVFGCVLMLALLARGVGGMRLRAARLKPHWHTLRRLIRVGIPNFLETLGMWAGNLLIILMVGRMGAEHAGVLGSHIVAVRIEAFSYLPGFAFASAAATLIGQYLGAGSTEMARKAVNVCVLLAVVFMGLMGVLFITKPTFIVGLFTAQEVHLALAPRLLFLTGMVQIPFAMSIVYRSALRGAGDVKAAMWLTWITTYLMRLPMAYAFSGVAIAFFGHVMENPFPWHGGLLGVWVGLCAEIVIRGVLFTVRFRQGHWARARV